MLSTLFQKTLRGIAYYQQTAPEIYAPYQRQLDNLSTQLQDIIISLSRWGQEPPQPDDPCPPPPVKAL